MHLRTAITLFTCLSIGTASACLAQSTVTYPVLVSDLEKAMSRGGLVRTVYTDALDGHRTAYSATDITKAYDNAGLKAMLNHVDTIYLQDPNPPYEMKTVISKAMVDPKQVTRLIVMEEWTPQKGAQPKREIKAMGPMDPRTDGLRPMPLFWVKYGDLGM